MSMRLSVLAALGALAVSAAPAMAYVTNFAPYDGQSNPLVISTGNNTVTFDSPSGPGTFLAGSTAGLYTFSNALADFGSFSGDTLTITFANPVTTGVGLVFGIEDAFATAGADSLIVTANTGQTATYLTTPDSLTLREPEGTAFFDGAPFTSLTLVTANASTGPNPFAIGVFSVPEPMSLTLLTVGLLGMGMVSRRRG